MAEDTRWHVKLEDLVLSVGFRVTESNLSGGKEKSSWWGCGQHVPMVMDKLPQESWCTCEPKVEKEGTRYPPMAPKAD
ncbi:hypothetical protein HO133_003148 [Letharia lupina]|uniref:Uncharacterized protein n=1 Tax=Letharia lupina TaxID=560253 RepID=A0A8H6FA15_9LECA|nr:uncharacterized protein HO133_003148 [Letharia lupina]KAF6220715.1 hypothetical protein HO133_003148 [Letharia lupina]